MAAQANPGGDTWSPLADFDVVSARGPQAAAFLHAQLATDVVGLGDGRWHWTCWLDPKGRVRALLIVLRLATDEFRLVLPFGRGAELVAALGRFVLRSKVTLAVDASRCAGREAAATPTLAAPHAGGVVEHDGDALVLALGGRADRRIRVGPATPEGSPGSSHWRQLDVADGIPWIAPGAAEAFTPQALSLQRLGAFELGKGCYPGQEIVARTHFLGRGKRRLARFEADAGPVPEPGSRLETGASAAADVVLAVAARRGAVELLASVHEDVATPSLPDGRTLRSLPLA